MVVKYYLVRLNFKFQKDLCINERARVVNSVTEKTIIFTSKLYKVIKCAISPQQKFGYLKARDHVYNLCAHIYG